MAVRKAVYALLLSGLFLLLLSALVVTPQTEAAQAPAPLPPMQAQAAVLPQPAADGCGAAQARPLDVRAALVCLLAACAFSLPRLAHRDSNGRVLRAHRYENSVYQVFRPEVAGG